MSNETYQDRKAQRREYFLRFQYGWIEVSCSACTGSGYYDQDGSPFCSGCDGTGKEQVRGPKAAEPQCLALAKAAGVRYFNYRDSNGDPQQIILDNAENK
jgi:hypothetical protein